jgi:hypothetical protein
VGYKDGSVVNTVGYKLRNMKILWLTLALAISVVPGITAGVSLTGQTIDCLGGSRYSLANIPVYAFNAGKSDKLNDLILAADMPVASDDIEVAKRAWNSSEQLVRFAKTAPRLARTVSKRDGSFTMDLPSFAGDLIVFAWAPSDEGPKFNYAYARVKSKGLASPIIVAFTAGCSK